MPSPSGKKSQKSKPSKARNYDDESGMQRTQKKKARAPPPPESSSEDEVSASDSEVEEEYDIHVKDVHRAKAPAARPRKTRAQTDTQNKTPGEEPEEPVTTVAPAFNFLVALAYRQGTSAVQFDARSFWIPDCYALFSAAFFICDLLTPNSLVHEIDPAFMSITFYLYVGHLFYYQVLRVRDNAGELTREERRCLRHYENVGPAESWPVPTPMIGILSSLAMVHPPSKYYGKVIPKLPALTGFTAAESLVGIHGIAGITRIPIIPAMQQFVHYFGTDIANFTDGILYPLADPTLTAGAAGPPPVLPNVFLGLSNSTANGHIQRLFFNSGWNLPTEVEETSLNYPHALKRALIHRMNVPTIGNTATISGLESFLGFRDGQSNAWMKNLLRSSSTVCRFFPDSTNLSAIPLITQEEIITTTTWSAPAQRAGVDDKWYRGRSNWTYSMNGKVNTESSGSLYKVAASASPNASFTTSIFPVNFNAANHSAELTGPYFANPAGAVSIPLTLAEIVAQPDPVRNMLTFIDEQLYDNLGGRSRS
nr:capsid protein [Sarcosphaera coronaria partitivirus]